MPIRLLSISASGFLGGAERSLFELLQALDRSRFELHVCAPSPGELAEQLSKIGVPVHPFEFEPPRRTRRPIAFARQLASMHSAARKLRSICKKLDIDIVHANTDPAALVAWYALRSSKLPFVWHCRDLRPLHGLARLIGRRASAVVAISEAVERHLIGESVDPEKLKLILNGIDVGRIPAATAAVKSRIRKSLDLRDDQPVIISVGAFVPWKRHELFLRMLAQLKKQMPDIRGLLVGSDNGGQNAAYAKKLRDQAAEFALGDTLKILGERSDVPDLLAAADLLVSCSHNEPFGRVLAEAGAAGLPVLATRSGAKSEIIEDGRTGLLVDSNVEDLTAACARLLKDSAMRMEMGRSARARIARYFDVHRTASEFTSLVESIVSGAKNV